VGETEQRVAFERNLMGIVSHDLRNPLAAISISAGLLLREGGLSERQERLIAGMATSAERANRMVRDLLDFTRSRVGDMPVERSAADLREVAQRVLAELRITHPEREVALHCEGDCSGEWDADRVSQVLVNLLSNAVRYSPQKAAISVWVRCDDTRAILQVHNEGPPIPDEVRRTLFEPMTRGEGQSDPEGRSLGLGLYIVDHIVRAHGGKVAANSTQAEGTTFTVTLPRFARQALGSPN
jgi:signal transduction histidine kinase